MAGSCETDSRVAGAVCLDTCIPKGLQSSVQLALLASISNAGTDTNALIQAAACLQSCIPKGVHPYIQAKLLCDIVNNTSGELDCDYASLINNGRACSVPTGYLDAIKTKLLCDIVNGGVAIACSDPDADAFCTAAGITNTAQQQAVCDFVVAMKANGTPSFWSRAIAIYPFVGGTAASHAVNLRNPGTYNLTYYGAPPPTHSALGMLGNGTTAYAATGIVPATHLPLNGTCIYHYYDLFDSTDFRHTFGSLTAGGSYLLTFNNGAGIDTYLYESLTSAGFPYATGGFLSQTRAAAVRDVAYNGGAFTSPAYTQSTRPTGQLMLLALGSNAYPGTAVFDYSASRFSGWACATTALTAAEWPIYHVIWQNLQFALGRMRP